MAITLPVAYTNLIGQHSSSTDVYVSIGSSGVYTSQTAACLTMPKMAVLTLDVAQTSPFSSHTLDAFVEHSTDAGITWDDFVHFTQVGGNKSQPTKIIASWVGTLTPTVAMQNGNQVQSMSVGVSQGPVGPVWRAEVVTSGASTSQPWLLNLCAVIG